MVGQKKLYRTVLFLFVLLGATVMLYPLLWMIASSFKPELMIFKDKSLIIREFTVEHYIRGWKGVSGTGFLDYLLNSFKVVIPVVIGNILSCSMVGFAIARLKFPGKNIVFYIILLTMMLPMHATLIPRYVLFLNLDWIDSYKPLTVPSFFAVQGFFCYLFIQFMRGIPSDMDQAATVDGCGPVKIYLKIIVPLTTPAFITTAIFSFIWTYDDFFSQLIYISAPTKFTVALALRQYTEALELSAFGVLFAMSSVSLIPIFVFFITSQKYLVEGIVTSGMKG
ncbi:MAG: carbohydrate ABC transporter permease [Clostridiaceae bacterium]|jgi:multiple sugar transport system permease protein|nr:carbohydrate ABC transporter permease [Clostridiaceae bacterium]